VVEEERLKAILESLLFAAAEPVALSQLGTVLESVARDDIKKSPRRDGNCWSAP
jgi:chromosome segregation and condensation protein ScpB